MVNEKIMFTKVEKCDINNQDDLGGQKGGKTFGPNIETKFNVFIFSRYSARDK